MRREWGPLCESRGLAELYRGEAPGPGSDTTPPPPPPLRFCSYQKFANCYRCFYKLQPEVTRSIYDQFISQLQTSVKVKGEANPLGQGLGDAPAFGGASGPGVEVLNMLLLRVANTFLEWQKQKVQTAPQRFFQTSLSSPERAVES